MGDFGLATSSLAAVDPSDVTRHPIYPETDLTLCVFWCLHLVSVDKQSIQRLAQGCISRLRYNRGRKGRETILRLTCILLAYDLTISPF